MGERYAVHLHIAPADTRGPELLDRVAEECTAWLRANAGQPSGGESAGVWRLDDDGSVQIWREQDEDDALYAFAWRVQRGAVVWTAEIQLATSGEDIDLSGSVRTDRSTSAEGYDRRIAVVADLIDRYDCRRANARVYTRARRLGAPLIDAFVRNWLLNPQRELPIIVVSTADDQERMVDAHELQHHLAGVARVFSVDAAASKALTERLGRSLSCYGGAIRIYRPGFTRSDPARLHPFWLSNAIRSPQFVQTVMAHAGPMSRPTPRAASFQDVRERIRLREMERLRAASQSTGNQLQALQQQVERERHWREEALKERDRFQSLYEQVQHEQDQERSERQLARDDDEIIVESVLEAVQTADRRSGECLSFLPDAFSSAEESRYSQPGLVLEALGALDRLARELRAGGVAPEQIVQTLKQRNLDCSTESEDTMRRYGEARRFRDETGLLHEMSLHIKFGGGRGANKRLRIHFAWATDYQQILVGHVGRHLRTGQS